MDHPTDAEWFGWHFAGRYLVSPHRDRISASLLNHLVFMHNLRLRHAAGLEAQASRARERRQKRLQEAQQTVKVVVVDLGAWKARHGLGVA